jgi:hypothetical protein
MTHELWDEEKRYASPLMILNRIQSASKRSPIAVFRCNIPEKLNAVFADTAVSAKQIENDDRLVGVYHRRMSEDRILMELRAAVTHETAPTGEQE